MKEKISRVRVAIVTVMLMVSFGIVLSGGNTDIAKAASKKPKLNKTKIELTKGETFKLKLSNSKNVKWSSNKKSVATVDKKGKVTAKKKGNAVISAKYLKKIYKCKVKVRGKVSISLSQTSAITNVADQIALSVVVEPSSETNRVVWGTSDEKVATVQNGIVTGVSAGTCVITASIGKSIARCNIQVNQSYGSVSGTITYLYNKYKGNVSDTNATVLLIPRDGTANSMPTLGSYAMWLMDYINTYGNDYKVYGTKVDGTGQFNFSNIPIGEYDIFIISKETTCKSWFDDKETYKNNIANCMKDLLNSDNAIGLGEAVALNNYHIDRITIRKDTNTTYSYDFGISYS